VAIVDRHATLSRAKITLLFWSRICKRTRKLDFFNCKIPDILSTQCSLRVGLQAIQ